LGGGNGSFAAAGDLALAGHQVRMWRRDRDAVANHCAAGRTIQLKDFRGQHTAPLELVTADVGAAVGGAELILCPTPAFAQADIAELLAPHLTEGQVVFLPPGTFGSVLLAKKVWQSGNHARLAFAETGTLPWLARKLCSLVFSVKAFRFGGNDYQSPKEEIRKSLLDKPATNLICLQMLVSHSRFVGNDYLSPKGRFPNRRFANRCWISWQPT